MILFLFLVLLSPGVAAVDPLMEEYNRAWALEGQARRDEAIPALKVIIEKNPHFFRAYKTLAKAFFNKNAAHEGEKYFRDLIPGDSSNPYPHYGLAELFSLSGRNDAALKEIKACLNKDFRAGPCYRDLGGASCSPAICPPTPGIPTGNPGQHPGQPLRLCGHRLPDARTAHRYGRLPPGAYPVPGNSRSVRRQGVESPRSCSLRQNIPLRRPTRRGRTTTPTGPDPC